LVPDAVNLASVHRILVVKLRHHGDVLLSSPVFQVLRKRAPHVEIDALVYSDTREMLEGHPAIDRLHLIDRAWKRAGLVKQARHEGTLLTALTARRYQLMVHLTEHWRGAWLAQALRPRWSVAPASRESRAWRWSFSHRYLLPRGTPRHTVELNLDALRRLGIYPEEEEKRLVMVPGDEATGRVDQLLAQHDLPAGGFIHVHPTSRWLFKAWTEEANAELLRRLVRDGHRVVVTAAPDAREKSIVGRILAQAPGVVDLSGQLTLRELAALAARARLFFGVDTAPRHIAAAMGTPVVVLFGPSDERAWGPWRVAHRVVDMPYPCRPCNNDGCGGGKVSECLTRLPVERVHSAVNELLAAGRAP
jgi:heptosyltransferase-3